jgi:hypothetical protein
MRTGEVYLVYLVYFVSVNEERGTVRYFSVSPGPCILNC